MIIFSNYVKRVITFPTQVVCNLVDFPFTISLCISLEINGIILIRKELILIDTAVNSSHHLRGRSIVEVKFEIRVEGALIDTADTFGDHLAFVVVNVYQLGHQLYVANVLSGLVKRTVQFENAYLVEFGLDERTGTFMPALRKNIRVE